MTVAFSAVFISLCALCVSVYEARLARDHHKASLWPRVEILYSTADGMTIFARNQGNGPAMVRELRITVDGKPCKNWREVIDNMTDVGGPFIQSQAGGMVLTAGSRVDMLVISEKELRKAFIENRSRLQIEMTYCSLYDECWTAWLNDPKPREIDEDNDLFQQ